MKTYFSDNENKSQSLLESIEEHEKFELMSRTPAFLWSLCELHQQTEIFIKIETVTQLFAWELTIYIQQHFRFMVGVKGLTSAKSPMDILDIIEVQMIVEKLSKIAKTSLEKNDLFIDVSEVEEQPNEIQFNVEFLEKSGFINVVKTSFGDKIQFYHLLMQEFLTAIHFMFTPTLNSEKLVDENIYRGVAPLFAGLKGACLPNSTSPKDLIQFVHKLNICYSNKIAGDDDESFAYRSLRNSYRSNLFLEILFEYQNDLDRSPLALCHQRLDSDIQNLLDIYGRFGITVEVVPKNCQEASTQFSFFTELNEYCNVEKFDNLEDFIQSCDSFKQRHKYKAFSIQFAKFKRDLYELKINCKVGMKFEKDLSWIIKQAKFMTKNERYENTWLGEVVVTWICNQKYTKNLLENFYLRSMCDLILKEKITLQQNHWKSMLFKFIVDNSIYKHLFHCTKNSYCFRLSLISSKHHPNSDLLEATISYQRLLLYFTLSYELNLESRINQAIHERCSSKISNNCFVSIF